MLIDIVYEVIVSVYKRMTGIGSFSMRLSGHYIQNQFIRRFHAA